MEKCNAKEMGEFVNIGTGTDQTIAELATLVAEVVGFGGRLAFDTSKPDGTPQKLLDVSRLTGLGVAAKDHSDGWFEVGVPCIFGEYELEFRHAIEPRADCGDQDCGKATFWR
jgi:hypothetical protein